MSEQKKPVGRIIADWRERVSGIPQALSRNGIEVKLKQLAAGDYILSSQVVVERKTTADFIQSIFDRRLFEQVQLLRAAFQHPLLILERTTAAHRQIDPNAWRGAILYVTVTNHIPILHARDRDDTVALLTAIIRQLHEAPHRRSGYPTQKPKGSLRRSQSFVLEALPGIGAGLTKALLAQFGSLQEVFDADERALRQVRGIGKRRAGKIREILQSHSRT